MAEPYPKSRQLARGERRYRRKVASPKQWQAIMAAKQGPCRVCGDNYRWQYHHLVTRSGHGDDVADNIVPLCLTCHQLITAHDVAATRSLADSLTDAERAYVLGKVGA